MNQQQVSLTRPQLSYSKLLQIYTWVIMGMLFVQGTGSLILRLSPQLEAATPLLLATLMNGNTPHAILHMAWGTFGLIFLATQRSPRSRLGLSLVFGTFYTSLGFLGIIVHNPFGLRLDWEENLFHLTVGPLMLLLSVLVIRHKEM